MYLNFEYFLALSIKNVRFNQNSPLKLFYSSTHLLINVSDPEKQEFSIRDYIRKYGKDGSLRKFLKDRNIDFKGIWKESQMSNKKWMTDAKAVGGEQGAALKKLVSDKIMKARTYKKFDKWFQSVFFNWNNIMRCKLY